MVHFDIKGDNILLEPLPGCSERDFWSPPTEAPPFKVLLADFGESRIFSALDADTTVRCGCRLSLQLSAAKLVLQILRVLQAIPLLHWHCRHLVSLASREAQAVDEPWSPLAASKANLSVPYEMK